MEDTPKGIQMQLNNLGRIISLRKEQGKSLSEVASAMEMTKEGWRQIEIAYNRTYQSAIERLKHPAEPEEINQIFQTINDYPFSIQQMENLNQLFGLSVKNAVPDSSGPIAFSPDDFLQKQLENAAHRDLRLTQDILECISICGESDLQLLRQTITLLVKRDSSFQHSLSSMLLDAVRNHITNTMRYALPDDECFQKRLNKLAHMLSTLVGCLMNVVLDPIAIFALQMGMKGAALATISGQIVTALMAIWYLAKKNKAFRLKRASFHLSGHLLRRFLPLGISSFITQVSIVAIMAAMNNVLVIYGAKSPYGADIPMTVVGIVMKVFQIVVAIVVGIAAGCQPLVGYNYGAGHIDRVRQILKTMMAAEKRREASSSSPWDGPWRP